MSLVMTVHKLCNSSIWPPLSLGIFTCSNWRLAFSKRQRNDTAALTIFWLSNRARGPSRCRQTK